jgi:hypothetical protein
MCMQPAAWPEPDPQIAAAVAAIYGARKTERPLPEPDPLIAAAIAAKYAGKRPRPLAVQVRDRLGQWLEDEQFAAAFGDRGRPGWSPSRLALVTILQREENLADRVLSGTLGAYGGGGFRHCVHR